MDAESRREDVSDKIPEELRTGSMNTFGSYRRWHFDEDWMEHFESYCDGLDVEEWIEENDKWLKNITDDYAVKQLIFLAIQKHDFRSGSCGGCI